MKPTLSILFFFFLFFATLSVQAQTTTPPPDDIIIQQKQDIVIPQKPDTGKMFTAVENEASYPGGTDLFFAYLHKNIQFKKDDQYIGKMTVMFLVGEDGRIMQATVIGGNAPVTFSKEVLNTFIKSPRWRVAIQNGRAVKDRFTVSFNFNISPNNQNRAWDIISN